VSQLTLRRPVREWNQVKQLEVFSYHQWRASLFASFVQLQVSVLEEATAKCREGGTQLRGSCSENPEIRPKSAPVSEQTEKAWTQCKEQSSNSPNSKEHSRCQHLKLANE
jgi:hypothetical protein